MKQAISDKAPFGFIPLADFPAPPGTLGLVNSANRYDFSLQQR